MCYEAKLLDGRFIETVGELKEEMIIIYDGNYQNSPAENGYCLCCVDFEKTAEANNLRVELNVESGVYSFHSK
jgi:hypothetical protein